MILLLKCRRKASFYSKQIMAGSLRSLRMVGLWRICSECQGGCRVPSSAIGTFVILFYFYLYFVFVFFFIVWLRRWWWWCQWCIYFIIITLIVIIITIVNIQFPSILWLLKFSSVSINYIIMILICLYCFKVCISFFFFFSIHDINFLLFIDKGFLLLSKFQ